MDKAVKIFISYAREDELYVQQFVKHLSALKRKGIIEEYYDRKISPGEEWDEKIKTNLDNSDIIIFLLSPPIWPKFVRNLAQVLRWAAYKLILLSGSAHRTTCACMHAI